jgi:lysophospholipase L1-like esterase
MRTASMPSFRRALWVVLPSVVAIGLAALPARSAEPAKCVLKKGDRLVVVGDSITEQKVYSRYIEDYLTACRPDLGIWCLQLGWGGETAGGFVGRMDQDLLSFKPNVVTTCYGMNDGGYRAYDEGIGKRYEEPMKKIVDAVKKIGATIVVGTPGAVDTKTWRGPADVYNDNLKHLADIDRKLAADAGMPFADVYGPIIEVMKKAKAAYGETYHVCGGDGVHPDNNGQLVMAYAFLKGLGLDGQIGTITVEADGKAAASDGHKVLTSEGGKIEVESTRYPFCFTGDGKSPGSNRSILQFLPFNDELNRFTLVVKGLKADKAAVTWGKDTKTFTADQLAKGVNLAAEFLDNPFSESFQKVDQAVGKKEGFETMMIKQAYHTLGPLARDLAGDAEAEAAVKTIKDRLVTKHEALAKAAREAVVPVKHTITIVAGDVK